MGTRTAFDGSVMYRYLATAPLFVTPATADTMARLDDACDRGGGAAVYINTDTASHAVIDVDGRLIGLAETETGSGPRYAATVPEGSDVRQPRGWRRRWPLGPRGPRWSS
jgi:hypothetical protein